MATYLTTAIVQGFLEPTKLTVQTVEPQLDSFSVGVTLGRLAARFDTAAWIDTASTPPLVLQLCALKYCSLFYRRQYSESLEEDNNYAVYLDKLWDALLDMVLSGELDIGTTLESDLSQPVFWPTDASTLLAETDPTNANASPLQFTMGRVF